MTRSEAGGFGERTEIPVSRKKRNPAIDVDERQLRESGKPLKEASGHSTPR